MFHCCSKETNFWENVETQYFASPRRMPVYVVQTQNIASVLMPVNVVEMQIIASVLMPVYVVEPQNIASVLMPGSKLRRDAKYCVSTHIVW